MRSKLEAVFKEMGLEHINQSNQIVLVKGLGKTAGHYGLEARFRFDGEDFIEVVLYDEFGSDNEKPWG